MNEKHMEICSPCIKYCSIKLIFANTLIELIFNVN